MKANRKLVNDNTAVNAAMVGGLVAFLIAIIVGVLVFWNISTVTPGTTATVTDTFTGYTLPTGTHHTGGSNDTAQVVTLTYVPSSTANSSILLVCYNSTAKTQCAPTVTTANTKVTIPAAVAGALPLGYDQVNVTYVTKIYTESAGTRTMANTVFALLPIIALVVVASVILGIVVMFGGRKSGGGGM